jgi:hypothetical protein
MSPELFILVIEESSFFDILELPLKMFVAINPRCVIFFICLMHTIMLIDKMLFKDIKKVDVEKFHYNLLDKSVLKLVNDLFISISFKSSHTICDPVVVEKVLYLYLEFLADGDSFIDVFQQPKKFSQVFSISFLCAFA